MCNLKITLKNCLVVSTNHCTFASASNQIAIKNYSFPPVKTYRRNKKASKYSKALTVLQPLLMRPGRPMQPHLNLCFKPDITKYHTIILYNKIAPEKKSSGQQSLTRPILSKYEINLHGVSYIGPEMRNVPASKSCTLFS